jgi:peptide/nickel transport system ATP-binding protein
LRVGIGGVEILRGVNLDLPVAGALAVVGESGSGKSMTAKALVGLLPPGAEVSGAFELGGQGVDLTGSVRAWRRVRGRQIVWLPQDPFTSLSALQRCGPQILAGSPQRLPRHQRAAFVERRLAEVGLDGAVARAYPHQLSGGMRQRVAIAAALAADPAVLIADEPTTALDASTQAEVLDLLAELQRQRGLAWLLISHDLSLARRYAETLAVFHRGLVVESGPVAAVLAAPAHFHTRELLGAGRARTGGMAAAGGEVILRASGVSKTYDGQDEPALREASLEVRAGQIVGIVGESGSGKTTLARCLVGLETPDTGRIEYLDRSGRVSDWRPRLAQLVFQNPYTSLNPSLTVRQTLTEAVRAAARSAPPAGPAADDAVPADGRPTAAWVRGRVERLLELVGLEAELAGRKPGKLSGGQRQRVAIARALAVGPRLLVCDEAVSALDAAIQDQVLETLLELRDRLGQAIVFISHDLAVVGRVADWVEVMCQGQVVESGPPARVLAAPEHPYTQSLIGARL